MNVFEEFKRLIQELEKQKVRYALVGGVAMAFYTDPRFTQDIDLLVESEDFGKSKAFLRMRVFRIGITPDIQQRSHRTCIGF